VVAPAGLLGLAWLQLAYHAPGSPRVIGWLAIAYLAGHLLLVARYGRSWLDEGEGFTVYLGMLGAFGPLARDGGTGRLVARPPVAGATAVAGSPARLAVVVAALGAVSFDGVSRLDWWLELVAERDGWSLTAVNTIGLAWMVGVAAAAYLGACRASSWLSRRDPDEVARSLAPPLALLAACLTVAHYVWAIVLDGQNLLVQLSDPFTKGWDLLGTGDWYVDYTLVTTAQVAWAQLLLVTAGHVAATVALQRRALASMPADVGRRSAYPVVAVVVASAVVGMLLVLIA
jgi:hypothetical protein